jgi:SAM-dependent methyltransferase
VQNAKAAHGDEPFMRFATIDLNRPLASQGLAPESLDAIIAVNVLHVAKDLAFTLRELKAVLVNTGYLFFGEGSPPDSRRRWRLDLVFAFLRGWWDVELDPVWRPRPGFLLPDQWVKILRQCGYQPVHALPGEGWYPGPCRGGLVAAGKAAGGEA